MSTEYRPEIDGLRAVAVVPVILFHAHVPGFTGGFVGVDVFFVISGFLITGILLRATQEDRFSLLHFYERRIRRIFPALFVVLLASTACAGWLLFPEEFSNFGKSLFATSTFYANYQFMHDTGYFAAPAESKPLLHMWSLAVEEQFYVVFPVYIYLAWRFCRRWLIELTTAICILSLGYSVWLMGHAPDQAFYSTPARAWELLIGSILAIWSQRNARRYVPNARLASIAGFVGIVLIVISVATFSEASPFPGLLALVPVLGAAAVIYSSGAPNNIVSWVLAAGPIRFIGLISFSLYLWHWPVFVFWKTYTIKPISGAETALMIVFSFLLAAVSWHFVEKPFRRGGDPARRKRVVFGGFAAMFTGVCLGAPLALSSGLPGRFSPEVNRILAARNDEPSIPACKDTWVRTNASLRLCSIGLSGPGQPRFAVWGDSHAEAIIPAISEAARVHGIGGILLARGGCPSMVGVSQIREGYQDCDITATNFMTYLADNPQIEYIILVSRWAVYAMGVRFQKEPGPTVFITDADTRFPSLATNQQVFERGLERTLTQLAALGRNVALVTQVPEVEFRVPLAMARALHLNHDLELAPRYSEYRRRQDFVEGVFERMRSSHRFLLVRTEPALCGAERCRVIEGRMPLYRDSNHLTASQALSMMPVFEPMFSGSWIRQ